MDGATLERKINFKFGTKGNFEIDGNTHLIRELGTDVINVFDYSQPANGRNLLKDSKQEQVDLIAKYFKFTDSEKEDDINSLIPD